MSGPAFGVLLIGGGVAIGLLPARYALGVGAVAVVLVWWWAQGSATDALAEGSIGETFALVVASWAALAVIVGITVRAGYCRYRRRSRVPL